MVWYGIMVQYQTFFLGHTEHLKNSFEGSNTNAGEIALAFYGGMWAYDGW